MSKHEARGKLEQWKGKLRRHYGKMTGSTSHQLRGNYEIARGTAREKLGRFRRRMKRR